MADCSPVAPCGRRCGVVSRRLAVGPIAHHVWPLGASIDAPASYPLVGAVVHAVTPGSVVADPVWWIGCEQSRLRTGQETAHVFWLGGIAAQQSVLPQAV